MCEFLQHWCAGTVFSSCENDTRGPGYADDKRGFSPGQRWKVKDWSVKVHLRFQSEITEFTPKTQRALSRRELPGYHRRHSRPNGNCGLDEMGVGGRWMEPRDAGHRWGEVVARSMLEVRVGSLQPRSPHGQCFSPHPPIGRCLCHSTSLGVPGALPSFQTSDFPTSSHSTCQRRRLGQRPEQPMVPHGRESRSSHSPGSR